MPISIDSIINLYAKRSALRYGSELVSQLEHALQCAQFALAESADAELAAAAFLHDIGHLVARRGHEAGREVDDLHQFLALPFLRGVFSVAVLQPIKLHVEAKRYLCQAEPGYWERLSPASKHSLVLQGGAFTDEEALAFMDQPYAREAVRLRRWDDQAKVPGKSLPDLGTIRELLLEAADCHKTAIAGA